MVAVLLAGTAVVGHAGGDADQGGGTMQLGRDSVLRVPANAAFPVSKRIDVGVGRSIFVQFPVPLKDVIVSDPTLVDAVVQASDRVFLIAKKPGRTNAFFFDEFGQQLMTLEVAAGPDLPSLTDLLARLIPGSNIQGEIAGKALVLTGTVRSPMDSDRAAQIAAQFVAAYKGMLTSDQSGGNRLESSNTTTTTVNNDLYEPGTINYLPPGNDNPNNPRGGGGGGSGGTDIYGEKAIINLITVEGEEQIMLRVSVAEVNREILKQFGINIGALLNSGNFSTAILSDNALPLTSAAGLGSLPTAGIATIGATAGSLGLFNTGPTNAAAQPYGNSGVDVVWQSGQQSVAGALRALERDGLVKLLAEPNLTAVSGEPAKFLAGGEFPVPVVDGLGQVSVQFKQFGIGLAFTPLVLSEGRISLKMETEVSELTNQGAVVLNNIQIPALRTRKASSTVELPSGGSLAMAGLLSETVRQNIDGFPGLKDLPILGTLFRSRDFQKSETELVVIVTPYPVRPVPRQQLARPLDGLGEPSDRKANFLGHINRVYGNSSTAPPVTDLKGDYGFIVE
jgi:pilus assembly protein CpaC